MRTAFLARLSVATLSLALAVPASAQAVTVTFNQTATDVVASTSGSLVSAGLTLYGPGTPTANVSPNYSEFISATGSYGSVITYSFSPAAGDPSSIGPGGQTYASTAVGDIFFFNGFAGYLGVPAGYVWGAPLSAATTWSGATFASLGLTPGVYNFAIQGSPDVVTFNVQSGVPEPATWAMMLLGFGGIGFAMRRSRRVQRAGDLRSSARFAHCRRERV